ncbi:hypothetical protein BDR05DRAFT_1003152 [Suillus weaverae]|nr:hypothetical protein BDR05DRAFT_1003152 [Suillus weaverae]
MTTTSMADSPPTPAAPIVDSPGDAADSLSALFEQLNISGPTAAALTVALCGFIQDTVIATVREVTVEATVNVSPVPNEIDNPAAATASPPVDATTATASVDANTASAPVGTVDVAAGPPAATVHTQLYGNVSYDVLAPNASGPYYWVTRGCHVGIFSTWQQTSSHVIGVSQASFSKVHSLAEGMQLMKNAIDCGESEWLI